jgi:signal transduction histidine kinase
MEGTKMDRTNLMELTGLLDALEQPVFFAEADRITYGNGAAAELGVRTGMALTALLGDGIAVYRSGIDDGAMVLPLTVEGRSRDASVRRVDGVDVFCVQTDRERAQTDAMGAIAQSIRQPLGNLFATANSLFSYLEEREDPKIQKQTAALNRSFYQLLRIAGNLTDSSQLLSGDAVFYGQETELQSFFADLADRVRPLVTAAGQVFEFACPTRHFSGVVDRQKLERAVLNLLSNAMKFTPKGGRVRLQVEPTRTQVIVKVVDSGEGMDAYLLGTAFDRYHHRNQLGDPRWGVGLGLPLVKKIAELHGGTLILQPMAGAGTAVTMSLSLRTQEDQKILKTPQVNYDYAGGYDHLLVELSDVLPTAVFDSLKV